MLKSKLLIKSFYSFLSIVVIGGVDGRDGIVRLSERLTLKGCGSRTN